MCLFDARYFARAVEYMKFDKENFKWVQLTEKLK